MDMADIALLVAVVCAFVVIAGVFYAKGGLSWFARAPEHVRFEGGSPKVQVPLTAMIVVFAGLGLVALVLARCA
jgi:hypothetical protein